MDVREYEVKTQKFYCMSFFSQSDSIFKVKFDFTFKSSSLGKNKDKSYFKKK